MHKIARAIDEIRFKSTQKFKAFHIIILKVVQLSLTRIGEIVCNGLNTRIYVNIFPANLGIPADAGGINRVPYVGIQ